MARRGKFGKAALLMGAAAVAAGVLLKRDKVAGLLRQGRSEAAEPSWTPAPAPAPANYDAPGPLANTATPVPAPEPFVREEDGSIDEQAEEAAAAAEAANIGGQVSDYAAVAGPRPRRADEADRPLVEAGEGSSEGQEQAEAALADAASDRRGGRQRLRASDRRRDRGGRAAVLRRAGRAGRLRARARAARPAARGGAARGAAASPSPPSRSPRPRPAARARAEPGRRAAARRARRPSREPAPEPDRRAARAVAAGARAARRGAQPGPSRSPPEPEPEPQGQIPFGDGTDRARARARARRRPACPLTDPEPPTEADGAARGGADHPRGAADRRLAAARARAGAGARPPPPTRRRPPRSRRSPTRTTRTTTAGTTGAPGRARPSIPSRRRARSLRVRLGFAVKVLGEGGLPTHDARRWQSGPHLRTRSRPSTACFDYLAREEIGMYRMTASLAPYATHPELPQFHRQLDEAREELARSARGRASSTCGSRPTPASTSS